jgi:hypothetical protein
MFKISVVVNTLNRIKTLPKTLNSFQYLRYPNLMTWNPFAPSEIEGAK